MHFFAKKFAYIKKKQYLCSRFRLKRKKYRGVEQW